MITRTIAPADAAEAARLALAAYDEGVDINDRLPAAWQALTASQLGLAASLFDSKGYFENGNAAGYVAVRDEALAIAFRGSDSVGDLITTAFDQGDYFQNLRPLIQAALDFAQDHAIQTVFFTGHSLGGAMVQRTAARIQTFDLPDQPLYWVMTAFGPPGTDVGNTSPFSRQVINVAHTGDPVPDDPLLSGLTQHGRFITIQLPNVEGAESLDELAAQKLEQNDDPSIVTEHDMDRYVTSLDAIEGSSLLDFTAGDTVAVVLDAADGSPRDDAYQVRDRHRLVLGLDGDDTLNGSRRRDLIDGGPGDDQIAAGGGDDAVAGGAGEDMLSGGPGADHFVFAGAFGDDRITDFSADEGDRVNIRGFGLDSFAVLETYLATTTTGLELDLTELGGGTAVFAGVDALTAADVILIA